MGREKENAANPRRDSLSIPDKSDGDKAGTGEHCSWQLSQESVECCVYSLQLPVVQIAGKFPVSEEGWRDTSYLVSACGCLSSMAPVLPGRTCSTWCGFFPVAVSCSEVIAFNFGYLSCASTIHPSGEQNFSPGLKTGGFYFLAESP